MNIKRKIILSISLILLGTFTIVYFIIIPTISDINDIKNAVLLERIDLEKKYLRGQLLNKALEDFETRKDEKEKLLSVFITEGQELEFVTSLENIAENNNILQTLSLGESTQSPNQFYKTSILSVTSQGSFNNILRYLDNIKELNYYYSIDQIDLNAASIDLGNDNITVKFSGKIFLVDPGQKI